MAVVVIVVAGGLPRVNTTGAAPHYVTEGEGVPITLVEDEAPPVTLLNADGTIWEAPE